ncbi:MAG TPA: hypothetical protein VGM05_05570 [Planctomycetaceae bacterium]|jgi:hypothetical protein
MADYAPSSLPSIESVEVVILAGLDANRVDDYMKAAIDAPAFKAIGDQALHIASLWRKLQKGQGARCHVPPFGLRFWAAGAIVCQASICWSCNNIFGDAEGRRFGFEFDAYLPISQDLLTELQRTTNYDARAAAALASVDYPPANA